MVAISVPPDWSLVEIDVHLLGFEVLLNSPGPQFPSETRLLVASPRRFDIRGLHVIDPDDASSQRLHGAERFEDVARPDGGCETVRRIVGYLDCVLLAFKRDNGRDRAEDFFTGDAGAVINVVEDGRLHVESLGKLIGAPAANSQLGFLFAEFLIGAHALVLLFAYQRPHLCLAVEWGAELDFLCLLGHGIDKFLVDGFLNQDAAARRADLSLVDENTEKRAVDGGFEIGVGEEDVRRLAAKFESDTLHRVRGLLHDDLAHSGAAREGNLVDLGMAYQWRAGAFPEASNHIDDARRQADFRKPFGEF